ncbi:MAG: YheT family hydrolase [Myxococcota bacterium]
MSGDLFQPAFGLASTHAQSLFGVWARPRPGLALRRQRRETPDGDFVDLDLLDGRPGAPTLVLLHGLEGSSESGYMRLMLHHAQQRGWSAIALNARSCSGEPNRQAASYSSGDYRDLSWLVRELEGRVFAVGFSLGASVLLNFLARDRAAERLSAAAAVSTPFRLELGARFLDSGDFIARRYLAHFLPSMKAKALAKAKQHPGTLDAEAIAATTRLRDFDHLVTARLFGFESAEHYYAHCSAAGLLERISTPTLLLSSKDDALAPPALPDGVERNSALEVHLTERGGHVGWVAGTAWRPRFWAEERVFRWLDGRAR